MEPQEQIEKFKEFIESHYKDKLYDLVRKGKKSLIVSFLDIMEFSHEIAEDLLDNPEDTLRSLELAAEQFELGEEQKNVRARVKGLPLNQKVKISDIRSEHLGKFLAVEGIVRQASDVRPQVTNAKFECPGCGNTISILQIDTKFKEPSRCTCGWRGRFRLLSKDLIDVQHLKIEESPESLEGGQQPKRLSVFLKEDLVEPNMERRTTPGSAVIINGIVKEVPILLKTGIQSLRYDLIFEANNIDSIQESYGDIELTPEDEEKIINFAKNPNAFYGLVKSIAPSIYGHERIKEALVLQLFGGLRKEKPDGTTIRGDVHVLLCGDPGSGKSAILQFISKAAPKARFVSGKGASSAGLCVAPDSLVALNPGRISKISDLVDSKLGMNPCIYQEGVWFKSNDDFSGKIFTLDENLKVKPKPIDKYWKLKPPEYMVKITTSYGKEAIVTPNTKLFSIDRGSLIWKGADFINEGDYLAACREFRFENKNKVLTIPLVKSNPIVEGVKSHIKNMINILCKNKCMTIRGLSRHLDLNENKLYHHWVSRNARGNIHLNDLLKLVKLSNYNLEHVAQDITFLSLRKGCRIKIPVYLNEEFMYFAGLIAGDGDICYKEGRGLIRMSNNSEELQIRFRQIVKGLFGCECGISSRSSDKRTESWRFGSKIIVEILAELGIPNSPKAHIIDMKNTLLTLPSNLLGYFLSGYFDADGCPVERKGVGSSHIEVGSASKEFSRKLQLVLIRFGIQSKLRVRPPKQATRKDNHLIIPKYNKHIIKISGKEYLELFRNNIGFSFSEKKNKLDRIIKSISFYRTNKDIVPGVAGIFKTISNRYGITSKQIFDYKTSNYFSGRTAVSARRLKRIVSKINGFVGDSSDLDLQKLNLLADSDVIWERVVKKERVYNHGYNFVYDLTVADSHNFIVNGLVVHNTAAVVKDEFLRGWALEAGALVLANLGIAIVDELDKMSNEDRSALHQALEQQTVTISKANVQATLSAKTTLLAAANPKFGRFDPYTPIASQIDLPPTLINRFDLIFPIRDIPNIERDEKIASHVLEVAHEDALYQTEVKPEFLRKYVAYTKQKIKPKMTKEAIEEIKSFYVQLRNSGRADEGGVRPIPISARQLEGLIRLSEASAKIRLDKHVIRDDARRAIDLVKYCLMNVGLDPETGQLDIDRISTGISASTRSKIIAIKEIISELDARGLKQIPVGEIINTASQKGIAENKVEEAIDQLKKSGDIFEPKRGFISKVG